MRTGERLGELEY